MTTARGSGDSSRAAARSARLRARTVAAPADRGAGTGVGAGSVLTCPTLVAPLGGTESAGRKLAREGESVHGGDFSEPNPRTEAVWIRVSAGQRDRPEGGPACDRRKSRHNGQIRLDSSLKAGDGERHSRTGTYLSFEDCVIPQTTGVRTTPPVGEVRPGGRTQSPTPPPCTTTRAGEDRLSTWPDPGCPRRRQGREHESIGA